jgi:RimJ/RimL family protein N-acetyltransferase
MSTLIESFTTTRLAGARRSPADYDDLRRLHQDSQAMATLSADGQPLAEEQTRASLRSSLEHWERHGYGVWTFRDLADGQFVGYCGLRRVVIDDRDEVELLYGLLPAYWGRGLASEMAAATLDIGFRRLGLAEVIGYTLPTNRASQRVMEKAGFSYERDIVHVGLPHVLYRLSAHDFR